MTRSYFPQNKPGGLTQLATGSLSGAAVNLTSISGDYKNLQLVIRNFIPATDGTNLLLRLNADTNTRYRQVRFNQTDGIYAFDESSIKISNNADDTAAGSLIVVDLLDYANTVTWKMLNFYSMFVDHVTPTSFESLRGNGFYNQTGAITEINLLCASGNFTSGTYILYGVK